MLVSHGKKFIYIKVPKTAGTSVEAYFSQYCLPKHMGYDDVINGYKGAEGIVGARGERPMSVWWNHMSAGDVKARLGDKLWDQYYKFCVIRNPFDRLVSMFWFDRHRKHVKITDPVKDFRRWLAGWKIADYTKWFKVDGKWCMNRMARYETLSRDLESVCKDLGLEFEPDRLRQYKAGIRDSSIKLADYYDKPSITRVTGAYAEEIREFGWEIPTNNR